MGLIEKTVFISYRRTNVPWALAISQYLTSHGYDVFFDFMSISSGDFEQIITENIISKAHFLVLLSPSALEKCDHPNDWLRREIEIAIDNKRNIVPILLEGFDFGDQESKKHLLGKLETLGKYNGLNLYAEYYLAGMQRLCDQFLNIPLDKIKHPTIQDVSTNVQKIVDKQKQVVAQEPFVIKNTLSAQEWFERAYKAKDPKEKIRLYSKAIELDPNFSAAYINRGSSFDDLELRGQAMKDYTQAIKLNPKESDAYYNMGLCNNDLKQYVQAIKCFNQAIGLNPLDADSFFNRGVSYYLLDKTEQAIKDYNHAIKLNSKHKDAFYNRGLHFAVSEQYINAIKDFDLVITINPNDIAAYFVRGKCYLGINKFEKAIDDFNHVIKLNHEHKEAYLFKGICFNDMKQYENAKNNFDKALKLDPENINIYNNRGISYTYLQQYDLAIQDYDNAINLDTKDSTGYYNKSCCYAKQGLISDAIIWLRKAFSKDPKKCHELALHDNDFDSLRDSPEFVDLLKEFNKG